MVGQQVIPLLSDETSHPILICLLGQFHLLKAGHPFALRSSGKAEALLRYLGIAYQRGLARDILLQLLWPDISAPLARQSLHSLVHSLHKLMGDAIGGSAPVIHYDGTYRLNVEAGVASDVAYFNALARAGDQQVHAGDLPAAIDAYTCATELYRGDLCIDLDVSALIEREHLRTRFLTLLTYLADSHYDAGNYGPCLKHGWRLLESDPCREDAHRVIMRCYVRQGKRAEALRQYRVCETVLRVEFDAVPESATTELFEQIRLDPGSI